MVTRILILGLLALSACGAVPKEAALEASTTAADGNYESMRYNPIEFQITGYDGGLIVGNFSNRFKDIYVGDSFNLTVVKPNDTALNIEVEYLATPSGPAVEVYGKTVHRYQVNSGMRRFVTPGYFFGQHNTGAVRFTVRDVGFGHQLTLPIVPAPIKAK
jgi:hypothetical protein